MQDNDILGDKLAKAVLRLSEDNAKAISKGLFRYAVQLEMVIDAKTVSSMLGHYDAGFTLRTYTHATRQKQEQAAEKMGNFMDKVM
ncbi:hypothetical protein [Acutalibacter caecimuris]|uniref:hypothetical protein n=1 Tax=Acutalibacter caecimuris TaxID=3093657 RepID=UPI002AC9BB60|nr:hypothetical protein [Acutalibacter sp. M00118]